MFTMIPVLLKYPSGPPTLISSDWWMSDVPMQHYQEIVSDGDIGNGDSMNVVWTCDTTRSVFMMTLLESV